MSLSSDLKSPLCGILVGSQHLEGFMQTSRFQLGLIATLAAGLGFSIASSDAIGYPAGAVSLGTNPVWASGGDLSSGGVGFIAAPDGQDMVVTDLLISTNSTIERANLTLEDGTNVGQTIVHGYGSSRSSTTLEHSFTSGIRIPAGTYLQINASWGGSLDYMFSGYYARP
jgi:hypothetical protein